MVGADHWPGGGWFLDHFEGESEGVPESSAGAAGRGTLASWPSDGADPGEAQPGVSFTVVHLVDWFRRQARGAGASTVPVCEAEREAGSHRATRGPLVGGVLHLLLTFIVRAVPGRLGG
ncbi:hypothetical protein GCM10011583_65460 [Streptomyces camponoticapitis]|uniref:Uncharacterized protein n=1 Tax=Streptomyces camponoticapitis TaxID=1616125 RepID=A0ABQ2EVX1_9ACTN|nr:hypothetical protein GCM10011583_65460 [Streptomyces camponoticapitis]